MTTMTAAQANDPNYVDPMRRPRPRLQPPVSTPRSRPPADYSFMDQRDGETPQDWQRRLSSMQGRWSPTAGGIYDNEKGALLREALQERLGQPQGGASIDTPVDGRGPARPGTYKNANIWSGGGYGGGYGGSVGHQQAAAGAYQQQQFAGPNSALKNQIAQAAWQHQQQQQQQQQQQPMPLQPGGDDLGFWENQLVLHDRGVGVSWGGKKRTRAEIEAKVKARPNVPRTGRSRSRRSDQPWTKWQTPEERAADGHRADGPRRAIDSAPNAVVKSGPLWAHGLTYAQYTAKKQERSPGRSRWNGKSWE